MHCQLILKLKFDNQIIKIKNTIFINNKLKQKNCQS